MHVGERSRCHSSRDPREISPDLNGCAVQRGASSVTEQARNRRRHRRLLLGPSYGGLCLAVRMVVFLRAGGSVAIDAELLERGERTRR